MHTSGRLWLWQRSRVALGGSLPRTAALGGHDDDGQTGRVDFVMMRSTRHSEPRGGVGGTRPLRVAIFHREIPNARAERLGKNQRRPLILYDSGGGGGYRPIFVSGHGRPFHATSVSPVDTSH